MRSRRFWPAIAGLLVMGCAAACTTSPPSGPAPTGAATPPGTISSASPATGGGVETTGQVLSGSATTQTTAVVDAVVKDVMSSVHLKAAIVKVSKGGQEVFTKAYGESMNGVPATTDMHFRNGAVAISYVATALLRLVDQKKVSLDDKVSRWLPDLKYADQVTLGQLARMTSGYLDYVHNETLGDQHYGDPFRHFTPEELLGFSTSQPLLYPPGTAWNYSHTNYVILGLVLEKVTGQPMADFLRDTVLGPLGLTQTGDSGTPAIPDPALHAYTSERRDTLKVPASIPFYEDSTYWDPSWTITHGAIQTTTIKDLDATAIAVGTGKLLSPESYQAMTSKDLIGKGSSAGCADCITQQAGYTYGIGLISSGSWLLQNPSFSGEGGAFAYLPSQQLAISVVVTFLPEAYDKTTGVTVKGNSGDYLWRRIASVLAPSDAPQIPPGLQ